MAYATAAPKVVPVVIDWLQKSQPADLKARNNSAQALAMTEVFTRSPVRPALTVETANNSASSATEQSDYQTPVLVHSIDVSLATSLLRLRFRKTDQQLAILAMNSSQTRQWLAILQVLWKKAGWPAHVWPHWLSDDLKIVSNASKGEYH